MKCDDGSMSPEALSSLFHHQRPIRPLPRRRLRERLSPDVADAIEYPPANSHSSPLFFYPNIAREDPLPTVGKNYTVIRDQGYEDHVVRSVEPGESDEEEVKRFANSKVVRRAHPDILNRNASLTPSGGQSRQTNPQPPPSTTSSLDGYDIFENTNNKKKRKIPTAGDSSLNGVHSMSEINSLGAVTSTPPPNEHDLAHSSSPSYYGSGGIASNQGISGPGRGKFGRARNGRSPLRALSDATNSWAGRGGKGRPQWAENSNEHPGIISSAIANAEKPSPGPGQENISLLQQSATTPKTRPASSQFTFTCDSQVPGTQWPGVDPATSHPGPPSYLGGRGRHAGMSSQAPMDPAAAASNVQGNESAQGSSAQQGAGKKKKKKSKRKVDRELRAQADERRRDAQYKLYHSTPNIEDMWICHFCEYERIFGRPPHALIRQYELNDQKVRRQEEERKRLLEKAKAKSRKAKKNSKSPVKNATSTHSEHAHDHHDHDHDHHGHHGHGHDHEPLTHHDHQEASQGLSNTTDDEEYINGLEDEFEGSYSQEDPPMLLSDDPDPEYPEDELDKGHIHRRHQSRADSPSGKSVRQSVAAAGGSF